MRRAWIAAPAVALLVAVAGCGDDSSDPDPGGVGGKTEIDGGETGNGSSTSTSIDTGDATGTMGGATQGNQIAPDETTPQTSQGGG
jgi:hypothetical protein